ncbi:MAG: hypothetical protein QG659_378 [Patescibacteria group bacterium]|jgi:hypothetical protein|nr:hypothetical protein [Patescibacteria group bacterium]
MYYHCTNLAGLPYEALAKYGAEDGIRTHDLLFTKQLLYQLSYFGTLVASSQLTRLSGRAPCLSDKKARQDGQG